MSQTNEAVQSLRIHMIEDCLKQPLAKYLKEVTNTNLSYNNYKWRETDTLESTGISLEPHSPENCLHYTMPYI